MITQDAMPEVDGTRLTPAGVHWDAIKVGRFYALQALKRLGAPGAVAVDPWPAEPVLYFFVSPGATVGWDIPQSTALGTATHVVLPPSTKERPPGPYWLIPPRNGCIQLTGLDELREALVVGDGPRAEGTA